MQYVNALVALGGDAGNTVPKARLSVAELQLLRFIHGPDAVFDVEPLDEEDGISQRDELTRLAEIYKARDELGGFELPKHYPIAAAVPETLEELDLPETAFKVLQRVTAKKGGKAKAKAPSTSKIATKSTLGAHPGDSEGVIVGDADHLFDEPNPDIMS